jgi:post-segregation antitoxin (ccd killing protein)
MRMARVNVYLPDELADKARAAGLSLSAITQDAIRGALRRSETDGWLDHLDSAPRSDVSHDEVIAAIDSARAELGGGASD